MEILLTNDDSHDSPLFHFLIEKLKAFGRVTVVVPKTEQSWTGKSMTRFEALTAEEIQIHGHTACCLSGTPADCANFGIYHLFEGTPDLVVSGTNIGINTGVAYAISSGTIGACLEANIAGVPAVALSQELALDVYVEFTENRQMPADVLARLNAQSDAVLDRLFGRLLRRADFRTAPVTWSANLPFRARDDWAIVPASLGHSFYGSCFQKTDTGYRHRVTGQEEDTREASDAAVLKQGHVSLTRLNIRTFGQFGLDGGEIW